MPKAGAMAAILDGDLDAVVVATSSDTHHPIGMDALAAGTNEPAWAMSVMHMSRLALSPMMPLRSVDNGSSSVFFWLRY